jgi:hypothetical protein
MAVILPETLQESREPGSPVPALFHKEEKKNEPYAGNFIMPLQILLDGSPTLLQ